MKCASGSMDRASDSGSEGWGFESLLAYQKRVVLWMARFLAYSFPKSGKYGAGWSIGVPVIIEYAVRPRQPGGRAPDLPEFPRGKHLKKRGNSCMIVKKWNLGRWEL